MLHLALALALALARPSAQAVDLPKHAPERTPAALTAPLALRDRLAAPLFQEPGDGRILARGRDFRAAFGADGLTVLPIFGSAAPHEFPVALRLARAEVAGAPLAVGVRRVSRKGDAVDLVHDDLVERDHVSLDGVEQTFVFDRLATRGELLLEVAVATELTPVADSDGLRFVHPALGAVSYGEAFALDARGARLPLEREWTGESIVLRVPAAFVAEAVLPLVVDPVVSTVTSQFGVADDTAPDVVWDGVQGQYWVVWEEYTSATNADCYLTSFDDFLVQGSSFAVDMTGEDWRAPRVAFCPATNRLLVVAAQVLGGQGAVRGQLVDALSRAPIGGPLAITPLGTPKSGVDVGGSLAATSAEARFCVVWTQHFSAVDRDVHYRVLSSTGAQVGPSWIADDTTDDTKDTAISDSAGDPSAPGAGWTIVWVRDLPALDGFGRVEARRIRPDGTSVSAAHLVVDAHTDCARPSVTSLLDAPLLPGGERPAIVAYHRVFGSATGAQGAQRSVYAAVVTPSHAYTPEAVSWKLEGVHEDVDQRDACVATDGRGFHLTYSEVYFGAPAGSDYDMYLCSGHPVVEAGDVRLALAERHVNLAFSSTPEGLGRVATRRDGQAGPVGNDAFAIWADRNNAATPGYGRLEGALVDMPLSALDRAVGRQFCPGEPNGATSAHSASVNSWLSVRGSGRVGESQTAVCQDVTRNATGYLLASRTVGEVHHPGSSVGTICVLGAGRYVHSIQSSGSLGVYVDVVTPWSIPSPTGAVAAAAGETWSFQYWHRDVQGGAATSNFSNACAVTFRP